MPKDLIFLCKDARKKQYFRFSVKFKKINNIENNFLYLVKMICSLFLKSKMFKITI